MLSELLDDGASELMNSFAASSPMPMSLSPCRPPAGLGEATNQRKKKLTKRSALQRCFVGRSKSGQDMPRYIYSNITEIMLCNSSFNGFKWIEMV